MIKPFNSDNYLIVGKNGFVASALLQSLQGQKKSVVVTSRNGSQDGNQYKNEYEGEYKLELDGEDAVPDDVLKTYQNIVFLAAISSPDICTRQYDVAHKSNVEGTARFIRRCLAAGCRVLFFSSDTVYGATAEMTDESGAVNPVGEYAQMKREVETLFAHEPGFKSARMSYVIAAKDKFISYLSGCCNNDSVAEIFHPFIRSPIWLQDVVEAIPAIFKYWDEVESNIINLVGPDSLSRLEIAEFYRDEIDSRLRFAVVEPPENFFQSRPRRILLESVYLERLLGRKCFTIAQALRNEFAKN